MSDDLSMSMFASKADYELAKLLKEQHDRGFEAGWNACRDRWGGMDYKDTKDFDDEV